jgi:AraC family transcriptional activator of tynA and feaB
MKYEKFVDTNFEENLNDFVHEERLIRFKELLQTNICEMDIRLDASTEAELLIKFSARKCTDFTVVSLSGSGHVLVRSAHHIASDGCDSVLFLGSSTGEIRLKTGGGDFVFRGGELAILDLSKPCVIGADSQSSFELTALEVPRNVFRNLVKHDLNEVDGVCIQDSCLSSVLNETFNVIARENMSLEFVQYGAFIETFLDLVNISLKARRTEVEPMNKDAHYTLRLAIQRFVDANLKNPELNHELISRHFGISVRQVHKVFEGKGITVGQYILNRRLQGAASQLRAVDHAHRKIGDIAFDWCFNELSHFSRAFKSHFSCTAREWRHESRPN